METKERAGRNRTLTVFPDEIEPLRKQITSIDGLKSRKDYLNKTINGTATDNSISTNNYHF